MRNNLVKRITIDGMFIALLVIMTFVPYVGFIPAGPVTITLIHVPVLIAAMIFGWKEGLLMGFVFGLCSLIKAAASPLSPLDPFFINPLVSVLPRVAFGGLAGLLFDLVRTLNKPKAEITLFFVGSVIMTFFHTVMTLACLFLFTFDKESLSTAAAGLINVLFVMNCLIEMAVAVIVVPSLSIALFKAFPDLTRSPFKKYEKEL